MRSAWCLGSGGFKTLIYVDYTVERKSSLQKNNAVVLWVSVISVCLSYCSIFHCHLISFTVNKQINDKERIAAAMENPDLRDIVEGCIQEGD